MIARTFYSRAALTLTLRRRTLILETSNEVVGSCHDDVSKSGCDGDARVAARGSGGVVRSGRTGRGWGFHTDPLLRSSDDRGRRLGFSRGSGFELALDELTALDERPGAGSPFERVLVEGAHRVPPFASSALDAIHPGTNGLALGTGGTGDGWVDRASVVLRFARDELETAIRPIHAPLHFSVGARSRSGIGQLSAGNERRVGWDRAGRSRNGGSAGSPRFDPLIVFEGGLVGSRGANGGSRRGESGGR